MAETIGRVVVEVGADTGSLEKDVQQGLGDAANASDKPAKSLASRFTGLIGKVAKRGLQVSGVAAGAALGSALYKGFGRLKAIDEAKAKLRGIGVEGKALEGVMDTVTKSVTGTAFGLDEAAGAAAGALSSGVKEGKELEEFLTLVGDAATQAGTDFNTMSQIMTKVQGSGKLTGETLQQLTENQLFALPMLAKAYKVPQDEMRKMVSEGKISAADFQKVLKQNIGGAAQESGKTFSGAFANMNAALGRFGAKLLEPVFVKGPAIFGSIGGSIDKLGPVAERAGNAMASALEDSIQTISDAFSGMDAGGKLEILGKAAETMATSLFDAAQKILPALVEIGSALAPLAGGAAVGSMYALAGAASAIGAAFDGLGWVVENFRTEFQILVGAIVVGVGVFKTYQAVTKTLAGIQLGYTTVIAGGTVAEKSRTAATLAGSAAAKVQTAAQWALNAAMSANPIALVVIGLAALAAALVYAYKRSETFRNIVNSGFAAIRDVVAPVINWIAQTVPKTFLRIANVIASTVARARAAVTGAWQAIRVVTAKVFGALAGLVRGSLNKVRAVTASVTGAVRKAITNAWNTARNVTTKTWNAISGAVSRQVGRVVSAVQSIPGKIGRFAGKFRGAGKSLMNALVKGISSVGGVAGDIAKGVGRAVIGVINSLIGKMNNAIPNKIGKGKLSINLPANPIPTISGYARGTNFAPGGVALVGEEGPELVDLPRGSRVYTASQTRNMTSTPSTPSAGSGFPSKVILRVGAREFTAYVEEIADGRIDAADSLAWQGA